MLLTYCSFLSGGLLATALQVLPSPSYGADSTSSAESFQLASCPRTIYIIEQFSGRRDTDGLSLVAPSAYEFAQVFQKDLEELTGDAWALEVVEVLPIDVSSIILADLDTGSDDLTYENGVHASEGYEIAVEAKRVFINGTGARGMFWGTRTLLQQLMISNGTAEIEKIRDAPAYATRGFMLDAGRKWYSPELLKELCAFASWFKMSEFHYHISDNYPLTRGRNGTWQDVYSHFSLMPEDAVLQGIIQRPNETLSRADFEDFQRQCALRGVTVIPEIEAPGHSLAITKWKPELALKTKDLLNLTHPDTIPTVKSLWKEFLPWFATKEVHIGADEYDSTLADDYISFVNEMSTFINETSGKRIRIWGTDEPSNNLTIAKEVIIQHWQYGQSDPVKLQDAGYDLINSNDQWAYVSLKNDHMPILPAPYPQFFNGSRLLNFAGRLQWLWNPALFNQVNTTMQLATDASGNKGAIMAAWNDNGPDATTQLEAYYAMRKGIPLVGTRAWAGTRGPNIAILDLDSSIDFLIPRAPGQNLDRTLRSSGNNQSVPLISWKRQSSENDTVTLGYGSKGMNYTLALSVNGPFTLSGPDNILSLSIDGDLVFTADGWPYPLRSTAEEDGFDSSLPGRIWTNKTSSTHKPVKVAVPAHITLTTDVLGGSRVWVNGSFLGRFEVFVYGGKNTVFSWSQMAFVAPLQTVSGGVQSLVLEGQTHESQDGAGNLPQAFQGAASSICGSGLSNLAVGWTSVVAIMMTGFL
ncbi:hypothetical protein FH972_021719 [Carpinus fangiana]|uniref:beta-N-acetylhexosaminidase n=1 Tax=Carpinus fangiana TaxID=176857 RepID=A0A5N6KQS7_9ROSI|nr:hypothetical protein FH972_021719 [Carpinus fangiana]